MPTRRICFAVALWFSLAPAMAESLRSVFTDFDTAKCRHAKGDAPEDYGTWTCPGFRGFRVILSAGDQRMSVAFSDGAAGEWHSFPAANDVYKGKVEWRLEGGRPVATILRWNVATQADIDKATGPFSPSGRVLVVSRLGGPSCHIGYVDARANADANSRARQIADQSAKTFRCGVDKPVVRGAVTPGLALPECPPPSTSWRAPATGHLIPERPLTFCAGRANIVTASADFRGDTAASRWSFTNSTS